MDRQKSVRNVDGEDANDILQTPSSRQVRWGEIRFYVFPNMLGDNPGVSGDGAPLTIGWKHESKNVMDIDCYEVIRKHHPRRRRKDLIMPGPARDTYLLGLGYRLDELLTVAEEIKKIKKSRIASMKGTPWSKFMNVLGKKGWHFSPRQTPSEPKIVCAKSG